MELASTLAQDYVASLDSRKVTTPTHNRTESDPVKNPELVRRRLTKELTQQGLPNDQVIQDLYNDMVPGLIHTASGRYFGFVIGGTLESAIAADWLVSAFDQNAGAYFASPSSAVIEECAATWLQELLGLPVSVSYAFVTGCQMAHVTALATARHYLLQHRVRWNVEEQGLWDAPKIRVLVGPHHETIVRAIRFLGMGTNSIQHVATTEAGTMDVQDVRSRLCNDKNVLTIVCLAAGELNQGLFDPIGTICDVAHEYGAWVHVDGAFGLWAAASPKYRHLLHPGLDKADSWSTDGHKVLNVPQDVGIVFTAHPDSHRAAFQLHPDYAVATPDAVRNQYNYGPEWSRRARGVVVYAALRSLGRQGVARLFEQCCELAHNLVEQLGRLESVQVLARPIVNQGLVRFLDPSVVDKDDDTAAHDAYTDQMIDKIQSTGVVWFGGTKWHGMRVMRISVCCHRTTQADIDLAVQVVQQVLLEQTSGGLENASDSGTEAHEGVCNAAQLLA